MALAAEAEMAALFITAKKMIPLRNTLIQMGWPQPKTPIQMEIQQQWDPQTKL